MSPLKPTGAQTPDDYIAAIDEPRRSEIKQLHRLIQSVVPKWKPYMQSGMLAYGSYHYKYASGREGDWCVLALASQKQYISVYAVAMDGDQYVAEKYKDRLPKADIGRSCIRFKRLEDIDLDILKELLSEAAQATPPGTVST